MEAPMSETNKAALRRLLDEAFTNGNVAVLDELLADNFVDHSPPPNVSPDKAGVKEIVKMFRSGLPDLKVTVEDMVAEGDKVAVRITSRGTHKGELMGIPATGRTVAVNEQHFVRFANGKIVEHWGVEDNLGMMQQLGVVQGV
jgi:steroid delta-isomerase-like uncharacterized protein